MEFEKDTQQQFDFLVKFDIYQLFCHSSCFKAEL